MLSQSLEFKSSSLHTSFVYVSEAHAEDEWPVGNRFRTDTTSVLWTPALHQSKTNAERSERALNVLKQTKSPHDHVTVYVDPVDGKTPSLSFEKVMGSWPIGFYVVEYTPTPILRYIAQPRHGMFELNDMWKLIRSLV